MNPKQKKYHYIIVGAGIAGLSAIKKIREYDTKSSILLLSNEDRLPYKRTKINKSLAKGFSKDEFQLFDAQWYTENNTDLCFMNATKLFAEQRQIELNGQLVITYEKLLLSQGSVSVIPDIRGLDTKDIHTVHTAMETEGLRKWVENCSVVLVIGGSIEGLETANQLVKMGKKVIVVERNTNPLTRFFPSEIKQRIMASVARENIEYLNNFHLSTMRKNADGSYGFESPEGNRTIDSIVVCAGNRPNTNLAKQAGLSTEKGVLVNEYMQTSDPVIFAAGDIAQLPDGTVSGLWHLAEFQGLCAGENMINLGRPFVPVTQRLKTSLFGEFYFSANFAQSREPGVKTITEKQEPLFREFYLKDGIVKGLVMANDKERDKLYQKAVTENWSEDEIHSRIPW